MDDYHAVFQLGSTFVLVKLPPYLHTIKSTPPTILVLVFDIVLVPSSEPSYSTNFVKKCNGSLPNYTDISFVVASNCESLILSLLNSDLLS